MWLPLLLLVVSNLVYRQIFGGIYLKSVQIAKPLAAA
jgi:hypothetical protein